MTDPTFDTLEALEAWERKAKFKGREHHRLGRNLAAIETVWTIRRVLAAHSHLLKGNDDGNKA